MTLLLRDVEVEGARTDVLVGPSGIAAIAPGIPMGGTDHVVEGGGGALVPGLHDHHVHLLAMTAALRSVDCASLVGGRAALAEALQEAPGRWVRAIGYHESIAGELDRHRLDAILPERPVRVQHRSGSLWMLNSPAMREIEHILDDSTDIERDEAGFPTGRLWRFDSRLRAGLPADTPDFEPVGRRLAEYGVTGVTDATPDLDESAVALIATAHARRSLPQRVTLLGASQEVELPQGLTHGPLKVMLRDHDLPSLESLAAVVEAAHRRGRPVAVHCVSVDSLVLSIAALARTGNVPGDRLEHAAIAPPTLTADLAALGLAVVTQPGFIRTRGDRYLVDVDSVEANWLYPYASLLQAGLKVAPSSDAPFGDLDPWSVMRSARDRTTASRQLIGPGESVRAADVLRGYLSAPDAPGGMSRLVRVGAPADLCLLRAPLFQVLREPSAENVRLTLVAGEIVYDAM